MMESLRMGLILSMMGMIFMDSSLYAMPDSSENSEIKRSSSGKRKASHSDFAEEAPSLKKPIIASESLISTPSVHQTKSLWSLNTLPSEVLRMHVLPYLSSHEGWKLMLTGNKRLRLAMDHPEMDLVWKTWYVREKNHNADMFAQEITSWKGLYRLTLDLQNVFKTLTFDEDGFFQQLSQVSPAENPLHLYVQALLQEDDKKVTEAFQLYQRAAKQNFKPAQDKVAEALDYGRLGQEARPEQDCFDKLKAFAVQGCERAQDYVAAALYYGRLGQEARPGQDRFDELKVLAAQGWERAQFYIADALYYGKFGQRNKPEADRFDELQALANQGWESAQDYVAKALYYGELGQEARPKQVRFDELKALVNQGWERAQFYAAQAFFEWKLVQEEQDRFTELKAFAAQGWERAQEYFAEVLYYGELGQETRPEQDCFDELKALANQGWERAQDFIADALYEGILGQNTRSEQDRFDELQTFAAKGHKKAQDYMIQSIETNRLGQTKDEKSLRTLYRVQKLLEFFTPQ